MATVLRMLLAKVAKLLWREVPEDNAVKRGLSKRLPSSVTAIIVLVVVALSGLAIYSQR